MKNIGDSVIHIGSSYTYSKYDLGELMLRYRRQHPEVHFNVITESSDSLFRRMLDGTIHMAFIRGDYDSSLNKVLVSRNNAYVVTKEPIILSDLKSMTRIGYSTNHQTQKQLDDWYTEQFEEPAPANMSVGYIDVAWQLVERGAGYVCCFVPEQYEGQKRLFLTPMCHRDGTPVSRNTWFFYATTRHSHGNRKALTKEQAKKIAMGHKADDHEEGQKNELSDFPQHSGNLKCWGESLAGRFKK